MKEVYLPDYRGGSIVNLMSSIANACYGKTSYCNLRNLPSKELEKHKNIILIVIDGLGYEFLKKQGNSFLLDNTRSSMTSLALPTTASAITTFLTGEAVQQHAFTSWFVYLKELGMTTTILPFMPRVGGERFDKEIIPISQILTEKPFGQKIKRDYYNLTYKPIFDSQFTNYTCQGAKKIKYSTIKEMFSKIASLTKDSRKKYVYSYWPILDGMEHDFGTESSKAKKHFREIDKEIKKFYNKVRGTDSIIIITADHGLITTPSDKIIQLKDHPKLEECLSNRYLEKAG